MNECATSADNAPNRVAQKQHAAMDVVVDVPSGWTETRNRACGYYAHTWITTDPSVQRVNRSNCHRSGTEPPVFIGCACSRFIRTFSRMCDHIMDLPTARASGERVSGSDGILDDEVR